MLLLLLLP